MQVAKKALASGRDVIALTLDFKSFFQSVDPSFLATSTFTERLLKQAHEPRRRAIVRGGALTRQLVKMIGRYEHGLPVGLSASAVAGNMVLDEFDRQVETYISPLYYGRYMDDLFIVLDNPGRKFRCVRDVWDRIVPWFNSCVNGIKICRDEGEVKLVLDSAIYGKTCLRFNSAKERCVVLDAAGGQGILDRLDETLEEISSERRLLPTREVMSGVSARALSVESYSGENVTFIGNADRVTVRRFALAITLASLYRFSQCFEAGEWEEERTWLLENVRNHVLPPHKIFDFIKYVPRIASLFVAARDWKGLGKLIRGVRRSVVHLVPSAIEDEKCKERMGGFFDFLSGWMIEEMIAACRFDHERRRILDKDAAEVKKAISHLRWGKGRCDELLSMRGQVQKIGACMYEFDLARSSTSEAHFADGSELLPDDRSWDGSRVAYRALTAKINGYQEGAKEFLPWLKDNRSPPNFLMFPTSRLSQTTMCRVRPECALELDHWRSVNRFVRGVNFPPGRAFSPSYDSGLRIISSDGKPPPKSLVTVVNLLTRDRDLKRSVVSANASRKRYEVLADIVNQLTEVRPLPDYVVFPELSVPRRFSDLIGRKLARFGISSVMGVEYMPVPAKGHEVQGQELKGKVKNSVELYLVDRRLGFPGVTLQSEEKGRPAIHEREELRHLYNVGLSRVDGRENGCIPVYYHQGVAFAVLICSELSNIRYRAELAGKVDILFVPAWNRDTSTFSAVVESAALDMHCSVVVANNRRYGDSRIRAPYKDSWCRDIVRIQGGIHDGFATGEVDVAPLRSFQSHFVSPDTKFKPVPDGFVVAKWRESEPWRGERD